MLSAEHRKIFAASSISPLLMVGYINTSQEWDPKTKRVDLSAFMINTYGNGLFAKVMWRGVYMCLFLESMLFRIVLSSVWFAIWLYSPELVTFRGSVIELILGPDIFGFQLSYMARKTKTI